MLNKGDKPRDIPSLSNVKGLKLVHLNVRRLPKKIDQLRLLMHVSNRYVLTLSETWLKDALSTKHFDIKGYTNFRYDRKVEAKVMGRRAKTGTTKRGGGLITYVLENLNVSSNNLEAHWIKIHRPNCKDVIVGNVYRSPSGNLKLAIDYLDETFKALNLGKNEVFIMGDFNVDFKKKTSADYKKLNFLIKANGLSQLISHTTKNNTTSNSLLDIILTNAKYINESGTLDSFISDHQPIYVVKKKGRDSRPTVEFRGRSYRHYNSKDYKKQLQQCDWSSFYKIDSPDEVWDYILKQIVPILVKMCPIRDFKIKNYRPEWVTGELIEQIKDRDYFYRVAKETGDEDAWNVAQHLRNTTNANIRAAKREHILSELEDNKSDYKRFWKNIRSVMPDDKGDSRKEIRLSDSRGKLTERRLRTV